jgi:hypothetical protein
MRTNISRSGRIQRGSPRNGSIAKSDLRLDKNGIPRLSSIEEL